MEQYNLNESASDRISVDREYRMLKSDGLQRYCKNSQTGDSFIEYITIQELKSQIYETQLALDILNSIKDGEVKDIINDLEDYINNLKLDLKFLEESSKNTTELDNIKKE